MKKRESSEIKNPNCKDKVLSVRKILEEKMLKLKSKKKLIISLICLVILAVIVVNYLMQEKTTLSGMTITQELMRALQYEQFEEGDEEVEATDNVKFSAFFLRDLDGDGYAEKVKGTCKEIGTQDTLYMEIIVQTEGYLKDAKVEIQGQNFNLQTALPKDEQLKNNYISNSTRTIEFNQMNNGTQKLFSGKITGVIGNNINNYSREDNKVILTGTYVKQDGTEVAISKEIDLIVDWYGTTKAIISGTTQTYSDLANRIDEENGKVTLNFQIKTNETNQKLILSKNHVEGTIPELNGYAPLEVNIKNTLSTNLSFDYNADTRVFTIDRTATVAEDGAVTTSIARNNSYDLEIIYPIEAYQAIGEDKINLKIPVYTYYEGYNNPSEQFSNPYKSNMASATMSMTYFIPVQSDIKATSFSVSIGKTVYKPTQRNIISKQKPLKIYNEISETEKDDKYTVRWYAFMGTEEQAAGITLRETKNDESQVADQFIKIDSTEVSMENITSNVGIYFSGADNLLKEDGWIKVYDEETGNLLVTFTKDNWSKYTASNPYKYELPVKHIRVETSETNVEQSMYVYNIKELDDEYITENFTREEFENLQYVKTTLNGYVNGENRQTVTSQANYEAPYSVATIGLSKNSISTQVTEENEKITITASKDESTNQVGWGDGSFLVKLPEEILRVDINDVTVNNSNIGITTYEVIENEEGTCIKINTENNNVEAQSYTITIDANITPDPRLASSSKNIELYAANNEVTEYYYKAQDIYDVNNNLNTEEIINKTQTTINLISPSSLLTNQTVSEYDATNNVVVAPQIAEITPMYAKVDNEKQTAKIGIQVKNNYASTISEIKILGKIPFKGNKAVISKNDLSSEFSTTMLNTGIEIPEELQGKVIVYYSENENSDKDLTNSANGWRLAETITNWENVKSFLINFGEEKLEKGVDYTFYYKVEIPEGVDFNRTSYSHHGVYFCLDTEEGKYRTQIEPNKLGLRIVEKYHLDLIKTQTGKEKLVPGATYSITEIKTDGTIGDMKTAVTNEQGEFRITNLYAAKTYEIQEIKTQKDYELNPDIIRYVGHVDAEGNLSIIKNQGITKEEIAVTKNEGEKHVVTVQVEDEAKVKLHIIKREQGTQNVISYAKFKLTGNGLPTNGKILTTNVNGEINLSGLKIGEEYTLTETKAEGYYLMEPIKFKVVNNEGVYSAEITAGTVLENTITEEDSLPKVNFILEDEKIPRYTLEINKIKKVLETELVAEETGENTTEEQEVTYLQGAKFRLYKGDKELGEYVTDENGKITINDLYQYVDGKDEEATYTLKEVLAPEGYAKVKDITFKVQNTDGTLTLINTEGKAEKFTVDGTTVKLTIEDSPSFKLIKKDAETGEVLANVKFAIYNVDNGMVPAKNSKGETIGDLETINGKEYYTFTTDESGIITADLPEGFYKAVELQAPEKYDIENATYYFGIGGSREGKYELQEEWTKSIGGTIISVSETIDGGYIVGGYFTSSTLDLGNGIILSNQGSQDGMIMKYNEEGEVEWAQSVGGSKIEQIYTVLETIDGGYIVGGYFNSNTIKLKNGITLTKNSGGTSYYDGMLIKYSVIGEVEWAKVIGGGYNDYIRAVDETSDGGYIVGGEFNSNTIILENNIKLINNSNNSVNGELVFDGMLIRYNSEGVAEWAKTIGGTSDDYIKSVLETIDGGYIVGGAFSSTIKLGNGITLTSSGSTDGMLIKYSVIGELEWAKTIGGSSSDTINSVKELSGGGYIVGGTSGASKYSVMGVLEWTKSMGTVYSVEETSDKGYIVGGTSGASKYSVMGVLELTKPIGTVYSVKETSDGGYIVGTSQGLIKYVVLEIPKGVVKDVKKLGGTIKSLSATSDGSYIVGGEFSNNIELENGISLISSGETDGMIIKYNQSRDVEWVKVIGGSLNDSIYSISETSDGGYIVGGTFSSDLNLGNGVILTNNSNTIDVMILKYNHTGQIEWAKVIGGSSNDYISSVIETRDGGYIFGGYFVSDTIDLGEGIILKHQYHNTYYGNLNGMIIKYNADGVLEWAKLVAKSQYTKIKDVIGTSDGGYIAIGDSHGNSTASYDGLLIKMNRQGEEEWRINRIVENNVYDEIDLVFECLDGYIITGYYYNGTEYVSCVRKYNAFGDMQWNKVYDSFFVNSACKTADGGCIVGGKDGIRKYTTDGEIEWSEIIGSTVNSIIELTNGNYLIRGSFSNIAIDVEDEDILTSVPYQLLEVSMQMGTPELQAITVENERKEFKITTFINEIDGIKGGTISGEGEEFYEIVKYGDNNIKEILMTPDEGYEIIKITINGEEYKFTANEDDTYLLQLDNITEDKHIEVTYSLKDNKIIINKEDSNTKERLEGATFKLDQIEERKVPEGIINKLTNNGQEYYKVDTTKEIINAFGSLTNNGTYYFVEQDGKYVPTNSKTYQVANGGTTGKHNTTANSYLEIDLTDKEGKYVVVVNALCTSEANYDFGYATITESVTAPNYNSSNGRFIYISGTNTTNEYTSGMLEGGKKYYLHLGYRKDSSGDSGVDQIEFNSIKLYETIKITYNFVENSGKYESTNQNFHNTVSNSYIPIDLTNCKGRYNLIVNANISSASGDYGYVTVSEDTTRPAYNSSTGRLIYITGTTTPTDYTTVLEGEKLYYLHLGYYKNASVSSGDDKFTVNSIQITPNADDLYHIEITTNADGQAITQIPFGKYSVTETLAPEGYELNENSTIIEFRDGGNHEFTYENTKIARVIVHHYIKDTETKVAEDDILQDKAGYPYTTEANLNLKGYGLEEDENENYIIPENAVGQFVSGDQEVIYYYVEKPANLQVNYYVEGTETPIELDDGTLAPTISEYGNEGENYTTQPVENVAEKYELVEMPENANGTYGKETETVNYYYRIKTYNVTTRVEDVVETTPTGETNIVKGGSISGEDEKAYEVVEHGENTTKEILIAPADDTHEISKITINGIEQEFTLNADRSVTLSAIENIKEDIEVVATFERIPTQVIVHHYVGGTTTPVPLSNGENAVDEKYEKKYGETYETNSLSARELNEYYELTDIPANSTGIVGDDTVVVTYYYEVKDYSLELTKYEKGTNKILPEVKFVLTDIATGNIAEYVTDENGKIIIDDLTLMQTYELQEVETVEGYLLNEAKITFKAEIVEGEIVLKVLEGSFKELESEIISQDAYYVAPVIQVSIENEPIFTLTKKGNKRNNLLPNAKFVIKELLEENGTTVEEDARDYYGNLVGQEEEIDGEIVRVVTTDENGEINEALKAGNYKIIEVQAPENYEFGEENTYYFEVKKSQNEAIVIDDLKTGYYGKNIKRLQNGEYVGIYTIDSVLTIPAEFTVDNQTIELFGVDDSGDIAIIKYDLNLKVKSVEQIGSDGWDWAGDVVATDDGGFTITGEITGDARIENGQIVVSTENGYYDGATTIKFNSQGEPEWINKIDPPIEDAYIYNWDLKVLSNGDYLFVGYSSCESIISSENTVNNEDIVLEESCYIGLMTSEGKIKWITPDTEWRYSWDYVTIHELANGNYLVSPDPYGNDYCFEISVEDGTILNEYECPILRTVFDDSVGINIYDMELTADGEWIFVGSNWGDKTILAEYTVSGEDIEFDSYDRETVAYIVKFNRDCKVEWAYTLDGISLYDEIALIEDGGILVAGSYIEDVIISAENTVNNEEINLEWKLDTNLILARYDENGKVVYVYGDYELNYDDEYMYCMQLAEDEYIITAEDTGQVFLKEKVLEATKAEKVSLEVINTYNGPENETTSTLEKKGPEKITSKEANVDYTINYNSEINYAVGNARVTIIDTLPYPIMLDESELAGGTYDETTNTITWIEEINNINTFVSGESKNIAITKELSLKYNFESLNNTTGTIKNNVIAKLELLEEKQGEYIVVKEETVEANSESTIEIPSQVIVHYYLEGTTTKLPLDDGSFIEDETKEGIVGESYTMTPREEIPEYYELVDATGNISGTYKEEIQEVTFYYKFKEYEYTVEYYYENVRVDDNTETYTATYNTIIDTYEDKTVVGYEFVKTENLPLTVKADSSENIIKVYYEKVKYEYTINYYYNGRINEKETEKGKAEYGDIISEYEDKEKEGYTFEKVENIPLIISTDSKQNVINVYYISKDSQIIIKYLDKDTKYELEPDVIVDGKVFDEYDLNNNIKEIVGYTLTWQPDPMLIEFTEDVQTFIFYYGKNTEVIVKYLEKDETPLDDTDNTVLADEEIVSGYVDKEYSITPKEIEKYTFVEAKGELEGRMTSSKIEVILYYEKLAAGVYEKHIDVKTGEILETEVHEGDVGEPYSTSAKQYDDYDLVEGMLPENAEGLISTEPIEVKYYYIRKSTVRVEYVDKITGEIIQENIKVDSDGDAVFDETESKNSTVIIEGHQDDSYATTPKEFEEYEIEKDTEGNPILPENAEGKMAVITDEEGNQITETVVTYYYYKKVKVIEKHVDVRTNEVLEETVHEGYETKEYDIQSKEFEGYDLVEEQLPKNAKGTMMVITDEEGNVITEIVVTYYYHRKTKVVVEYVDKITREKIKETIEVDNDGDGTTDETNQQDSTVIIEGHEGDSYETTIKTFKDYEIIEEEYPENAKGTMEVITKEDETKETTTYVKYYYVHKSAGVRVEYIDAETQELLEEPTIIEGNEGDSYTTTSKEFEDYELVEERLPENAEGKMQIELIVVKYYYEKEVVPEIPVEPENPTEPDKPIEPDKPVEPDNLEEPTPGDTDEPTIPNEPKPERPKEPEENARPNGNNPPAGETTEEKKEENRNEVITVIKPLPDEDGSEKNNSVENKVENNDTNITDAQEKEEIINTGDMILVSSIATILLVVILNIIQIKYSKKKFIK